VRRCRGSVACAVIRFVPARAAENSWHDCFCFTHGSPLLLHWLKLTFGYSNARYCLTYPGKHLGFSPTSWLSFSSGSLLPHCNSALQAERHFTRTRRGIMSHPRSSECRGFCFSAFHFSLRSFPLLLALSPASFSPTRLFRCLRLAVCVLLLSGPGLAQDPFTWTQSSIGGGGFCLEIRFAPPNFFDKPNSQTLYLATDVSGVYRSEAMEASGEVTQWTRLVDSNPPSDEKDHLQLYTHSLAFTDKF